MTTADVAELHGSLSHIPYQANRTLGVLSKMMNLAETWGMRDKHTNPCEDIERYPERKRERFLSPVELRRLGQALATAEVSETETKYAVAAFRILLLTGCRLSEIQTLEWRHVDLVSGITDPRSGLRDAFGELRTCSRRRAWRWRCRRR